MKKYNLVGQGEYSEIQISNDSPNNFYTCSLGSCIAIYVDVTKDIPLLSPATNKSLFAHILAATGQLTIEKMKREQKGEIVTYSDSQNQVKNLFDKIKQSYKYGIIYINREYKNKETTQYVVEYLQNLTYDDNKKIFRETKNNRAQSYCIFESRKYIDRQLAGNACQAATQGTSNNEGMIESNKTGEYDYS